jgi:uridylate kinase
LIKATRVNGVFSQDPLKNDDALHFESISYDEFISNKLSVMDTTSIVMCRDNKLPVRVYDMNIPNALFKIVRGEDIGTLIS